MLGSQSMTFAYFSLQIYTTWLATSEKPFNAFKTAFDKRFFWNIRLTLQFDNFVIGQLHGHLLGSVANLYASQLEKTHAQYEGQLNINNNKLDGHHTC